MACPGLSSALVMGRTLLGIDIGGSGIKGAPVDVIAGTHGDRTKILTPDPATPEACADVVAEIVETQGVPGPIGVTVPGVVRHGVVHSAANIDKRWIGTDARALFGEVTGRDVIVLNDADAAGIAEMRFGAGRGLGGTVAVLTFGTGIGSGLFVEGRLASNTELGHIEFRGGDAEHFVSGKMRNDLTWEEWTGRVSAYLSHVAFVLGVDAVVFGGGISKQWDDFVDLLDVPIEVVPAELRNYAGIVGAALAASEAFPA